MENWESKSMVVEKIADDLSKKKKNADYVIGWLLVITCETLFQKGNAWPDAISVCESLGLIRKTEKPFGFPSFFSCEVATGICGVLFFNLWPGVRFEHLKCNYMC
jgi:hypothetical protein